MPPTAPQANHVAMIPLSLLVTAPDGAAPCLLPQEIYTAADGTNLELIIADGSNPAVDLSRPGLKHVRLATTDVYALMHAGMRAAAMPWVVVIEDHCRPLPDFLDAYRRAIAENPHADAVAGTLENLTTVDPWSFASFLLISWRHWPPTGDWAGLPSTANFALRKAALSDEELARPGGIVIAGFSRLAAAGRTVRCIPAAVDHVRKLPPVFGFGLVYRSGKRGRLLSRHNLPSRPVPVEFARDVLRLFDLCLLRPLATLFHLRNTPEFRVTYLPRFAFFGLASALAAFAADVEWVRGVKP